MARLAALLLFVFCCVPATAAAQAPPANVTPPAIDDTSPAMGDTLHAGGDTWDDPLATVTYQWRRCDDAGTCADIAGALGGTYAVVPADARSRLQVRAIAANAGGSATSDSPPSDVVPDIPPQNAAKPSITGTARRGETLTAQSGSWSGTAPVVSRQWLRCDGSGGACGAIAGATGPAQLLGAADEGHTLRVRETASNGAGQASADSDPTALVPTAVGNATPPVVTGSPVVGSPLISSAGTWTGTPPFVLTRRWQRCPGDESTCADIPGRVSNTYTLESADAGSRIRVLVRATNETGDTSAASALTAPVTTASAPGGAPPPATPQPAPPATPAATASPLAAVFAGPRRADLARALQGLVKFRSRCTGPCRVAIRLTVSRAVARAWRVPRTIATGRRALAAPGRAVVRPRFATTTRKRLRRMSKLTVVVVAQAKDDAGTLAAQRRWKLTLTR